jgi:predicted  nucleic acid-binding Zn-ribbon protein
MSDAMDLLRALDAIDVAIVALVRERDEIPRALAAIEERGQAALDAVAAEKHALEEAEKLRRTRERELSDTETQRAKYQQQTAQVKTNEEYAALLREIDAADARISHFEDEILLAMEAVEEHGQKLRSVTAEQQGVQKDLAAQADARRARLVEVEREIEARREERAPLLPKLEAPLRAIYSRVHAKHGTGTARVRGRSCVACHHDVPLETVNRVRNGEVHACGHCARLLVGVAE